MNEISNFSILNQNIRSLRKNFDLFVSFLESEKLNPDILVLTEIWVNSNEINFYRIKGYNVFSKCNETYRAGGVAVYVRDCYQCCSVRERDDVKSADCLQLDCRVNDLDSFTLLAAYRLHSSSPVQFLADMDVVFKELERLNIVYVADGNINILVQDNVTDAYLEFMSSKGMLSLVNEPTRIVGNSQTCIDHTFVRFLNRINHSRNFSSKILHYNITDHSTVFSEIRLFSKHILINQNEVSIRKLNFHKLIEYLNFADWGPVFEQISVSTAFELF